MAQVLTNRAGYERANRVKLLRTLVDLGVFAHAGMLRGRQKYVEYDPAKHEVRFVYKW